MVSRAERSFLSIGRALDWAVERMRGRERREEDASPSTYLSKCYKMGSKGLNITPTTWLCINLQGYLVASLSFKFDLGRLVVEFSKEPTARRAGK